MYGFADGMPTVTLASEEPCSGLLAVDEEWVGLIEPQKS